MKGFKTAIENEAIENTNFRKVLYTSKFIQLVLMNLLPKEEIGLETHQKNDQFFRVEKGHGKCVIDKNEYELHDGDAVVVPCGTQHNIINLSENEDLKLYTIYSPPHHKDGIFRVTKADAATKPEEFDGKTTEKLAETHLETDQSFQGHVSKLEAEVYDKISAVKLKRIKKKLEKNAHKIAKFESKIDKLKAKMTSLHETCEK